MLSSLLSGAAFGAALTATGMYQPTVILSQMKLENWHMVQTFLTASGTSTLVVTLCQKLGYLHVKPRSYSSLGLFGPLDGNIIGGCILGVGMTLSGSCPGSVFAQVGAGVPTGRYTLGGSVLGGIVWSTLLRPALASLKSNRREPAPKPENLTVHGILGISQAAAAVGVGVVFAAAVTAISALGLVKTRGLVGPVLGGFLVAAAQLFSALVRKSLLGTSGSFEELGDYISWLAKGGGEGKPRSYSSTIVVTGMMLGALGLSLAVYLPPTTPPAIDVTTARLVLGGILLTIGARIGGGCTSGHGITGISLLSISSFVTVAAMFAGAFGAAAVI
ncbi:putative family protein [Rosellinia necatrix]|uniref:Putative family protein n=1 Tax=Rosellinia necatrix TaxID=77044 RepID=A0A1S7UJX9_ROSNE|nr:putative family protein [Rosellinia necatrix]